MTRPVVIGAGHNGLVCAAYLAKGGRPPIVLEASSEVGGCAITHELSAGIRAPAFTHAVSLRADIAATLGLEAGNPVVVIERLALGYDRQPIEYRVSRAAADTFRYQIEIS